MKKMLLSISLLALMSAPSAWAATVQNAANEMNSMESPNEIIAGKNTDLGEFKKVDEGNTCYFDSQYVKMKEALDLTCDQEAKIDCLHKSFVERMNVLRDKKHCEQMKLCKMIENDASRSEIREQKKVVKGIHRDMKAEYKQFRRDVRVQLLDDQKSDYRKFNRDEFFKMRKLAKNCRVYAFPCMDFKPCAPNCESKPAPKCGCGS